jgi:hypothetical protein
MRMRLFSVKSTIVIVVVLDRLKENKRSDGGTGMPPAACFTASL